jgi:hypothetical protein
MSKGPPSQPVCPHNHAYLCLNNSRYARQLKQSILNGAQLSYDWYILQNKMLSLASEAERIRVPTV